MLTKKEIIAQGAKYGLENITDEEYESNKKFTLRTCLTRIKNSRNNVGEKARHDGTMRDTKAIILGGRDFMYKKLEGDVTKTRSQRILVLEDDDNGIRLSELQQWGHLKKETDGVYVGANNGDAVDIKIEVQEGTVNDTGVRYPDSHIIREIIVKKPNLLQFTDPATIKDFVANLQDSVGIISNEDIGERHLYSLVAFKGEVCGAKKVASWSGDQRGEDYPLFYNEQPCLAVNFSEGGSHIRVRGTIGATNLAEPFVLWDDLIEICKNDSEEDIIETVVGRTLLILGYVRRCKLKEDINYIDIDIYALIPYDEFYDIEESISQVKIAQPPQEASAPTTAAPATPSPAPQPTAPATAAQGSSGGATAKVEEMKNKIREAREILGDDITPEALYELGTFDKDSPPGPQVIKALISKVLQEA